MKWFYGPELELGEAVEKIGYLLEPVFLGATLRSYVVQGWPFRGFAMILE